MKHRRFSLPHATKLTLVAVHEDGISATGVAMSPDHALRLARAEMQERCVAASFQSNAKITGFGTGQRQITADKRAKAEAIERYAVDCWWFHGHRPLPSDPLKKHQLHRILHSIGRVSSRTVRAGSLAHIENATVFYAMSFDKAGQCLCFGFGTTLRRSVVELMQMEFAYDLLTFKVSKHLDLTPEEETQWERIHALCLDQIEPLLESGPRDADDVLVQIEPLQNEGATLKISCAQIVQKTPYAITDSTPWRSWSPF